MRVGACLLPAPRQLRVLAPQLVAAKKSRPLAAFQSGDLSSELMRPEVASVSPRSARRCQRAIFCKGSCSVQNWDLGSPDSVSTCALTLSVATGLSCLASVSLRLFSLQAQTAACHCSRCQMRVLSEGCQVGVCSLYAVFQTEQSL